jgi:hypothetical protein
MDAETRVAIRAAYRQLSVRSRRTHDMTERASLQAAAGHLRRTLTASAGQFNGAVIVLLVEGDEEVDYGDGDTAPLHCTLCFLGDAEDLGDDDLSTILTHTERCASQIDPFDAEVVSPAEFGETPVCLVEHENINGARDYVLEDPTVATLAGFGEDHPGYLPHVSGLDDRETVRFDRIAVMTGGDIHEFPLRKTSTQTTDDDLTY